MREAGVYSEIVHHNITADEVMAKKPLAIILSGGPSSVYEEGSPQLDAGILELGVPVLGICYGFQTLANALGGRVDKTGKREYGATELTVRAGGEILDGQPASQICWMSHGDQVMEAPAGFEVLASTETTPVAAFADSARKIYGVQWHPEVKHSQFGQNVLENFLHKAAGIAQDGDADRCLAVDHTGAIVDGDQIMAILALSLKANGELARNTLVATVMSNLGLKLAMREHNIEMIETKVGDRYVLEELREHGYTLGGEQSGHVILSKHATTGDGVLTGLRLMAEVAKTKTTLRDLASVMKVYPQVLINVRGVDRTKTDDAEVQAAVKEAEADLKDTGRVLLRPSGTEPVVRVMVEAADEGTAQSWADRIARVVERRLAV